MHLTLSEGSPATRNPFPLLPLMLSSQSALAFLTLTVLPIPNSDISATVHGYAAERRRQLEQCLSTEETLIFYGAKPVHINAIREAGAIQAE